MTRLALILARFPRTVALLCAAALRSLLGWVVAFPIVATLSALGVGSLAGGDRALFAPSALLLVETLRVGEVALLAAAQTSLFLWLLCALVQAFPTALVFAAFADLPHDGAEPAFRRALALTPRFIALGAVDCGLCALTFGLGFLAWPVATSASSPTASSRFACCDSRRVTSSSGRTPTSTSRRRSSGSIGRRRWKRSSSSGEPH